MSGGNNKIESHLVRQKQRRIQVEKPHETDVVCGRGGIGIYHTGNCMLRKLITSLKARYLRSSRPEKMRMISNIVQQWPKCYAPGRFLKQEKDTGFWISLTEREMKKKVGQLLREGAPHLRKKLHDTEKVTKKSQKEKSSEEQHPNYECTMSSFAKVSQVMTLRSSVTCSTTTSTGAADINQVKNNGFSSSYSESSTNDDETMFLEEDDDFVSNLPFDFPCLSFNNETTTTSQACVMRSSSDTSIITNSQHQINLGNLLIHQLTIDHRLDQVKSLTEECLPTTTDIALKREATEGGSLGFDDLAPLPLLSNSDVALVAAPAEINWPLLPANKIREPSSKTPNIPPKPKDFAISALGELLQEPIGCWSEGGSGHSDST